LFPNLLFPNTLEEPENQYLMPSYRVLEQTTGVGGLWQSSGHTGIRH